MRPAPTTPTEELEQQVRLLIRQRNTARLLILSLLDAHQIKHMTHAEKSGALKMIAEYLQWTQSLEEDIPF